MSNLTLESMRQQIETLQDPEILDNDQLSQTVLETLQQFDKFVIRYGSRSDAKNRVVDLILAIVRINHTQATHEVVTLGDRRDWDGTDKADGKLSAWSAMRKLVLGWSQLLPEQDNLIEELKESPSLYVGSYPFPDRAKPLLLPSLVFGDGKVTGHIRTYKNDPNKGSIVFTELDKAAGVGPITDEQRGPGKETPIFVMNFKNKESIEVVRGFFDYLLERMIFRATEIDVEEDC